MPDLESKGSDFDAESAIPESRGSSTVITKIDDQASEAVADEGEAGEGVNDEVRREAYGPEPGEAGWNEFEVRFEEGDPENPKNWSRAQRWYLTVFGGVLLLNATFSSSAPTGIIPTLQEEFHFSLEVAALLIALFVAGYCVGPLLWGPLSEQYGRRPIFIISFGIYVCFQIGCALSKNIGSLLAFRFLAGTFAAGPLTNSGAVISDIWDAKTRGKALAFFTLAPFAGPSLGPTVGGFMAVAGVDWRWLFWLLTIFSGVCWVLIVFTHPETYAPTILVQKARRLRKETGDNRYWAPLERQDIRLVHRLEHILVRPFKIMFLEPMLLAVTLYMSFVYGCIYLLFEAYPIVYSIGHHLNEGLSGLTFLPIFVGGILGAIVHVTYWNPAYERLLEKYDPKPVPPEYRMDQCLWASPIFAVGFFWFAWTSYPSLPLWASVFAGLPLGFSIIWIFLGLFNYIIDVYLFAAASALAGTTIIRSLFGAGFPLFANQMYEKLNPRWASTLLGFIAVLMAPIPFILKKYGPALRKKSKFAQSRVVPVEKIEVPSDEEKASQK